MLSVITVICTLSLVASFHQGKFATRSRGIRLAMVESQVLAATPSVEEWLDVAEPGLKRATLAMFRACKEIAYKIRTASCDKMACFNEFGTSALLALRFTKLHYP